MTFKGSLSLIAILALSALLMRGANAGSINTYLSRYISNASINSATFYNQTVNGSNYIIMRLTNNTYVVIQNQSGSYSLVTNASIIDSILTPLLTSSSYPSTATLQELNASMQSAKRYGYANLTDCYTETGLISGETCTFANGCFACKTVPDCSKVLESFGGVNSPFGLGIINFSVNYTNLNNYYNSYFSILANINHSNAGTSIENMLSLENNISYIYSNIGMNPIFPPAPGENFASCNYGANPITQPWYCTAVGFCSSIPENATALATAHSLLVTLQQSIPSTSGIQSLSTNSSTAAKGYLNAYLATINGASYTLLINSITPKINAAINSSESLLSKYNNATLISSVSSIKAQLAEVQNAGINQNITQANKTLQRLLQSITSTYAKANASYNTAYLLAQNNTAQLLADQLNYIQIPNALASLANKQQTINSQLNHGINSTQISAMLPELQEISVESALFIAPLTIGYAIKLLDNPFIDAMLAPYNTPIPQKMASAAVYAAIESLIIGVLIVLVIAVITYFRVIRKGKLKNNKGLQRTWTIVFVALIILVAIYAYATYAYAVQANSFLPFGYFMNNVKASSNIYIALNGSASTNSSIASCVGTIQRYLEKATKNVKTITLNNYSCISGSNISVLGLDCYNNLLATDKPVIFISQSSTSNITYKGLYGTVLYAQGNVTEGQYCTLGTLFRNV